MNIRIGQGYDVHQLVEQRPLILGGVTIPHHKGLLGHSDADALLHAITDALLGAAALPAHYVNYSPTPLPNTKMLTAVIYCAWRIKRCRLLAGAWSMWTARSSRSNRSCAHTLTQCVPTLLPI